MDKIICIVGPTASGKTKLSVALAQALDAEIISFDSMQIYRGMDIGTAKPTMEERGGVVHHMFDVAEPNEDFSVSRYVEMADQCLQDILARNKTAILVGGTGLYVDSLIAGREFAPYPSTGRREELEQRVKMRASSRFMKNFVRSIPKQQSRSILPITSVLFGLWRFIWKPVKRSPSITAKPN